MLRSLSLLLPLLFSTLSVAEPLYWQAKKGELTYTIMGSVHIGDESMYPLPKPIMDRLNSSDGLIIETDIRKTQGITYPEMQYLSQDVLSSRQKSDLKGIAKFLELNDKQLLSSPPWATALTIQMKQTEYLGYQAALGVDAHLMYKATIKEIPILSLESLQFQVDLFTGQPESGKEFLVSAIEEFDHVEGVLPCLIESWQAGDKSKLEKFAQLAAMSPELEKAFIHDRNADWAQKLANPPWSKKQQGQYLMVVGALHLVGEDNVLDLLKQNGFSVSQQSTSSEASCNFKY
ncbi:TraB/GumN family protein [Vibrio paucivorans]